MDYPFDVYVPTAEERRELTAAVGDFRSVLAGRTELNSIDLLGVRLFAVQCATHLAIAKGKPGHAVYLAADLTEFLLTGVKPVVPEQFQPKREAQT